MLSAHPSAGLEYWYFKVNFGSMALLVDWIAKRRSHENILRVSIHSPYKREVVFEKLANSMTEDIFLRIDSTKGQAGEIAWDMSIRLDGKPIVPDMFPVGLLKMGDMSIISQPLAYFSGWIQHGKEKVDFQNVAGMISHYWGRSLAPQWWWFSVQQFEQTGFALEAMVIRSKVLGIHIQAPISYIYLRQPKKEALTIEPFGLSRVKGTPESFEVEIPRIGSSPIRLIGKGRDFGDLGDGIMNTLVGDLQVWEGDKLLAEAKGTAAIERREP